MSFCAIALPLHELLRRTVPGVLERASRRLGPMLGRRTAPLALSLVFGACFVAMELVENETLRYVLGTVGCFLFFALGWLDRHGQGCDQYGGYEYQANDGFFKKIHFLPN